MFREANMVVSPHGAGLVNTIYSNDISIVEAFGSYCNGCYFTLSGLDKITYNCVIGKSVGSDIQLPAEALPKSWFTNNH